MYSVWYAAVVSEQQQQAIPLEGKEQPVSPSEITMFATPEEPLTANPSQNGDNLHNQASEQQAKAKPAEWIGLNPNLELEPLFGGRTSSPDRKMQHPPMLRLELALQQTADQHPQSAPDMAGPSNAAAGQQSGSDAVNGAQQKSAAEHLEELATLWARQLRAPNAALAQGARLEHAAPGGENGQHKVQLLLDVNDSSMTFELRRGQELGDLAKAAATIVPAPPKLAPVLAPLAGHGKGAALLARHNVSKDAAYSTKIGNKGERVAAQLCKHATPAASLLTLPIRHATRQDLMHRPVSTFLPAPMPLTFKIKVGGDSDKSQVKISSLLGKDALVQTFSNIILAVTTAADLWDKAKTGKFAEAKDLDAVFWLRGQAPRVLAADMDLKSAGVAADGSVVDLAVTFPRLRPLPNRTADAVPDPASGVPMRPPGAFMKKKDLTAVEGHIVLLEYLEEQPLLLSRQGMGVRLTTYYRKRSPTDADHQKLIKGMLSFTQPRKSE